MNAPQRDPLNAVFDRYADATAAETTRLTSGQLRRRMRRHRTARVAAAGVAAAVLAVPGGWMLQQANATDEPTGAADQGRGSESPPCVEDGRYALLAEGTSVEDYLAADEAAVGIVLGPDEGIEEFAADPELYQTARLAQGLVGDDTVDAAVVEIELGEQVDVVEFYGDFEPGGSVQILYPCDAAPTESPSESGTPGGTPTGGETPTAGEEPTEAGEEPTEAGEEPTEAGEEPTEAGEAPTSGYETPTAGEEPTPGDDPSEHSTP